MLTTGRAREASGSPEGRQQLALAFRAQSRPPGPVQALLALPGQHVGLEVGPWPVPQPGGRRGLAAARGKPSQPGSATHIGSDSGPMYSATPWPSSQAGSASTTGPVCPPSLRACLIQRPNGTTGPTVS